MKALCLCMHIPVLKFVQSMLQSSTEQTQQLHTVSKHNSCIRANTTAACNELAQQLYQVAVTQIMESAGL